MAADPFAPMTTLDPFGEVLRALRVAGTFYCRSELTAPWGLGLPAEPGWVWFHVVTEGRCTLSSERFAPIVLLPGSFVLVPHGLGHQLATGPNVSCPNVIGLPQDLVNERYSLLRYGGGGAPTTLVCGVVRFEHRSAIDLVRALPSVIHFDASRAPQAEWMQHTLQLMAVESRSVLPGGETVISRLADILVVQALRAWLRDDPSARSGWLGAMRDPQIGRALAAIHRDPVGEWTVASLASAAAMSRSAFAARFTALLGETPMRYVTRARMEVASELLRGSAGATMNDLASRVGYRSEAAFGRAFKRSVGVSPGRARRERPGSDGHG